MKATFALLLAFGGPRGSYKRVKENMHVSRAIEDEAVADRAEA